MKMYFICFIIFSSSVAHADYFGLANPTPLQTEFFTMGRAGRYQELEKIINQASQDQIKELLLAELSLALFIVARVNFDLTDVNDSSSFDYAEQTLLKVLFIDQKIRAQWAFLLLNAKNELTTIRNFNVDTLEHALGLIAYFLNDMGALLNPYESAKNIAQVKEKLFVNARKLFDIYKLIQNKRAYPEVEQIQQRLSLQPPKVNRPAGLRPITRPAPAKPARVTLVPVTKPAPAQSKPQPIKLIPVSKPAPAKPLN